MSQSPSRLPPLAEQDQRSPTASAQEGGVMLTPLVAAAIAIGRMPGEPAAIVDSRQHPAPLTFLFGRKTRGPLADPRLEVIRAISASVTRGIGTIRADLIVAAANAGWTLDDLSLLFPAVSLRAAS